MLLRSVTSGESYNFKKFLNVVDTVTARLIKHCEINFTGKRINEFEKLAVIVEMIEALFKTHTIRSDEIEKKDSDLSFKFPLLSVSAPLLVVETLFNSVVVPHTRHLAVPVPVSFTTSGVKEFREAIMEARKMCGSPLSKGCEFAQSIASLIVPKDLLGHNVYLPNVSAIFEYALCVYKETKSRNIFDLVDPTKLNSELRLFWNAFVCKDIAEANRFVLKYQHKAFYAIEALLDENVLTPDDVAYIRRYATAFPKNVLKGTVTINEGGMAVDFAVQPEFTTSASNDLVMVWSPKGRDKVITKEFKIPRGTKNSITLAFDLTLDVLKNKVFAIEVMEGKSIKKAAEIESDKLTKQMLAAQEAEKKEKAATWADKTVVPKESPLIIKAVAVLSRVASKPKEKSCTDIIGGVPSPDVLSPKDEVLFSDLLEQLHMKKKDFSIHELVHIFLIECEDAVFCRKPNPDLKRSFLILQLLQLTVSKADFVDKTIWTIVLPYLSEFELCIMEKHDDCLLRHFVAKNCIHIYRKSWKIPLKVSEKPMECNNLVDFLRKKIVGDKEDGFIRLLQKAYLEGKANGCLDDIMQSIRMRCCSPISE
jgi:hypothetical protein